MDVTTPAEDGFYMPAEWRPHKRCWMAWPCRLGLWGEGYDHACLSVAAVARAIAGFEEVVMLVPPDLVAAARLQLGRKVSVMDLPLDDSWTRDSGPIFVSDEAGRVAAVDWKFNGWGNRWHDFRRDDAVPAALARHEEMRCYAGPMVLEGGAVHVDGAGTLLAVRPTILNDNRNPTLDERQVEQRLTDYLGVMRLIWLDEGLAGDDTDGHVDNVARFVAPATVMCAIAETREDPDYERLKRLVERLGREKDALGRPLEIIEVAKPAPRRAENGAPLMTSYINFYIANGGLVVPGFDDDADDRAAETIQNAFPDRELVQVPALPIVAGGGGIHCITQQQPEGPAMPAAEAGGAAP